MWLLIVPFIVLLFIVIVSMTALAAAIFGLLGSSWPVLLIAFGAWLLWSGDGRQRRRRARHMRHAWAAPSAAPAPAPKQPATREPRPIRKPELPIDVQVKVEQIRRKVDVLLGYAERFPPFSKDLFLVKQTAVEYLPRTIEAYLAMPPHAAERPLTADGKTPHQELKAQLDLLDAKLDQIAQDLQRQDMERLLANRRFLEERFGRASA
jgi:ABC-type nickel/cobalt efflux system permease component RcnA